MSTIYPVPYQSIKTRLEQFTISFPKPGGGFDIRKAFNFTDPVIDGNKSWVDEFVKALVDVIISYDENFIIPNIISFWDNTYDLPTDPADNAAYIATVDGSGWTKDNIYIWVNDQIEWMEVPYVLGRIVYLVSQDKWYGAKSIGWVVIGEAGSLTNNPIRIGDSWRLRETENRELWIEYTKDGDVTWQPKQKLSHTNP